MFDEFLRSPSRAIDDEINVDEPNAEGDYDDVFAAVEAKYPSLAAHQGILREMARVESSFNPAAVSPKTPSGGGGAEGLMQAVPATTRSVSGRLGRELDPFNAEDSIEIGAYVLDENLRRYKGDITRALMAYNNGTDPARWNNPETQAYPGKVLGGLKKATIAVQSEPDSPEQGENMFAQFLRPPENMFAEFLRPPNTEQGFANFKPQVAQPESAVEPEQGYLAQLGGALSQGFKNTELNTRAAGFQSGAIDSQSLASSIAENERTQTPRPAFVSDYEKRLKGRSDELKAAEGFVDNAGALASLVGEAITNPKAIGYQIAESLPNFIPSATLGVAGAAAGSAVGPVGTVVGGYAGMSAGTVATETGAKLIEMVRERVPDLKNEQQVSALLEDPEFAAEALKQGLTKGAIIAGVDALTFRLGGKVLSGPARQMQDDISRAYVAAGVKAGDKAATSNPAFIKAIEQASARYAASTTVGKTAARGAGALGIETVGEGAGEGIGEYAASGKVNPDEILTESLASLGQSTIQAGVSRALELRKLGQQPSIAPQQTFDPATARVDEDQSTAIPPGVRSDIARDAEDILALDDDAGPTETPGIRRRRGSAQAATEQIQPEPASAEAPNISPGAAPAPSTLANSVSSEVPLADSNVKRDDFRTFVERAPVADIDVDPRVYQFRSEVDKQGVDDRLSNIKEWDDLRAGTLVVHERADGRRFVADGHHRLELAQRLKVPDVNAIVLREADGYTTADAKRIAALKNLSEDNGTPVDAAKVFRNEPGKSPESLIERLNLPKNSVVRQGVALAKLSDESFNAVVGGVVSERDGAVIGNTFSDPAEQQAALKVFARLKPANLEEAEIIAQQIRQAGFSKRQTDQGALFAASAETDSLLGERAKVIAQIAKSFVKDRALFNTLEANAGKIEGAGNKLARDQNRIISDEAGDLADRLGRLAFTDPDLKRILDNAARAYQANPRSLANVIGETKEQLRGLVRSQNESGAGRGTPGRSSDQDGAARPEDAATGEAAAERDADADERGDPAEIAARTPPMFSRRDTRTPDLFAQAPSEEGVSAFKSIGKLVSSAIKNASQRFKEKAGWFVVGKVTPERASEIQNVVAQKLGAKVDVASFSHIVDEDAVRKVLKDHGTPATEQPRGNIPVTEADFELIPEIIRSGRIVDAGVTYNGLNAVTYEARIGSNYFYVEEVRTGRGALALKTMWKRPGRSAPSNQNVSEQLPEALPGSQAKTTSNARNSQEPPARYDPAALAKLKVERKAIDVDTGKSFRMKEQADTALADVDNQLAFARRLRECLTS